MSIYPMIKDAINGLHKVVNDDEIKKITGLSSKNRSIARKAQDGTLQFPVLVTRALDIETMTIINKALERNYSSFLQIAFSMDSKFQVKGGAAGVDYIKQFHTNHSGDANSVAFTVESFSEVCEKLGDYFKKLSDIESIDKLEKINEKLKAMIDEATEMKDIYFLRREVAGAIKTCETLKTEKFTSDDDRDSINSTIKWLKNDATKMIDEREKTVKKVKESFGDLADEYITENLGNGIIVSFSVYDKAVANVIKENKAQLVDVLEDVRHDILNNVYKPSNETVYNFKDKAITAKHNATHVMEADTVQKDRPSTIDLNRNMLTDNDVKKSNELVPTMLHVRVNTLDSEGANAGVVDFNVGVKAIMHPVKSDEMVANVVAACKNNNAFFNFIRWTSGEIKFVKDFLLDIDNIKLDVYNRSKGASPWWLALKRRRGLSKMSGLLNGSKPIPNTTIVISAEEVELIKSTYGYDLYNPFFVDKIMEQYFLLGFVIVDNSSQVAHFKFDNNYKSFETVSFSSLERENTNSERKFKDMLKVLSRN